MLKTMARKLRNSACQMGIFLPISFLLFCNVTTEALNWLTLTRISTLAAEPYLQSVTKCDSLHRSLVKQEMKFCRNHPAFMKAIRDGAKWAIEECQFQFKTRRWNCSTLNDDLLRVYKKHHLVPKAARIPIEKMQRTQSALSSNVTIKTDILGKKAALLKQDSPMLTEKENFTSENDVSQPEERTRKRAKNKYKKRRKYRGKKRGKKSVRGDNGPVFPQGTREAAFVHAISSAGVAHAITRRCSSGLIEECGCDRSVRGTAKNGFLWEGCSDNIAYGISLSKRFVDAKDMHLIRRSKRIKKKKRQKMRVARSLMNLHNNEAGRKLLEDNMRIQCKCHGVSGSCEMKTCWKAMPSFREIGEHLKEKFDGATQVKPEIINGRTELRPNQQFFKRPSETDLVYLTRSPEYCERDLNHGSLGTSGRRCNKESHSLDGCDLLCCGRGYSTHWVKVKERCKCKFHWCCYVKCSVCTRNEQVNICN